PNRRDDLGLLRRRAGAQRAGVDQGALGHQRGQVELAGTAALQADDHEPAVGGERVEVAREVRPTHVVEDAVRAPTAGLLPYPGDEILGAVIDRDLGAEPPGALALVRAARGGEDAGAEAVP